VTSASFRESLPHVCKGILEAANMADDK